MDISILVVNYNTAQLVKKCIESLQNQENISFEIIVIDNNSKDESIAVLQPFLPHITFIANQDNKGFGKANNQAFRLSKGRYIFMLNPDAFCMTNQDLFHAVKFMNDNPQYGLAGTRILNVDYQLEKTVYHHYPRQKQTHMDFSILPGDCATVLGASMIVRREVFEAINGFDEEFFLYGEETDLCLRIRKAGYMIGYCEAVTVLHVGSASEKSNPREEVIRKKKAGKLLFYRKHYPIEDVRKIVKQDLSRARFHLWRLTLIKLLFGINQKQEYQYRRHTIVYQLTTDFLRMHS